jgi:hypothetical protein
VSARCALKIQTPQFGVHLEGDADLVRIGYEGLRQALLERLAPRAEGAAEPPSSRPRPASGPRGPGRPEVGPEYVWVYRSNDLYHKVHVVQRRQLYVTGLGRYLQPERLARIYVESEDAPMIEGLIPPGKTLWSELTRLGRERLRKG